MSEDRAHHAKCYSELSNSYEAAVLVLIDKNLPICSYHLITAKIIVVFMSKNVWTLPKRKRKSSGLDVAVDTH